MASHPGADRVTALIVEAAPGASLAPAAKPLVGGLPMGQIMWPQAPGTASAPHIRDAIADLSHRLCAGSAPGRFAGQQGLQDLPLLVTAIGRLGGARG